MIFHLPIFDYERPSVTLQRLVPHGLQLFLGDFVVPVVLRDGLHDQERGLDLVVLVGSDLLEAGRVELQDLAPLFVQRAQKGTVGSRAHLQVVFRHAVQLLPNETQAYPFARRP